MTTADLYFGRAMAADSSVSDADWRRFLDEEVTPRFPRGLTVENASGQWNGADGVLTREASKHLIIVLSGAPDEQTKLVAVREAYKRRFHQESVLILEYRTCGSF
ncbi:MAG: DUF3574 domain-containing protein [Alphaproteobacteria bacterium]|nr:DUF3574 domain-containing protein [Alphaproteobacteria bacterium]MDE2112862.1 DUF3574 domain-containing protein [Alphaproteobacteria bacterium]MDE2493189.1 DUF3574 domain-containing protein [Alphaproteobacteria bacterium]